MPVYNNYNAYGGQGVQNPRVVTPGVSINGWNGNGNWNGYNQQPQQSPDGKVYVNGRAGADAFQLPAGVNYMVLWDTESNRFFEKGYDNNGMPRVLADNDFTSHVEPEPVQKESIDLSSYATKDDIKAMIQEAFSNATIPSMVGYVTRKEMDQAFSELSLGSGGRIVRTNE